MNTGAIIICIVLALCPITFSVMSIAASMGEAEKHLRRIWSMLGYIRYGLQPEEVPDGEQRALKDLIEALKQDCRKVEHCASCKWNGYCPQYVKGCPEYWGESEKDDA